MLKLIRTNSENKDFQFLVSLLDAELSIRDGDEHAFFAQFNKLDSIREVVVAFQNEVAIGCGAFKKFDSETAEIKRMFVRLEHRGKGIAVEILRELENWASELNFSFAILETGYKQPEAIRLYEKTGFALIPNYGQYEGVENSVCMKKELTKN